MWLKQRYLDFTEEYKLKNSWNAQLWIKLLAEARLKGDLAKMQILMLHVKDKG